MSKKYLIVEGHYDHLFYDSLFENIKLKNIKIVKPRDLGRTYNGKGNCIQLLNDLVKQLFDGSVSKIGMILDADFCDISSQGFLSTLNSVNNIIEPYGYNIFTRSCDYNKGIIFNNSNLPEIALWIMPDNSTDGYLEYFIFNSICKSKQDQLNESMDICKNMRCKSFPDHQHKKSELAVFMSMQENPGRNISHLIENKYLDLNTPHITNFCNFIKTYFSD